MRPLIPFFHDPVQQALSTLIDVKPEQIPIHTFGLLVAAGFLLGSRVAMTRAKRVGLDPEQINRLVGWLVIGTFVGGHVGYGLMYEPAKYLADPKLFLYVWDGLSSWGGFLVCVPLSVYFFRSNRLPLWPYLDSLAIGLTVGWFLGRMGCFSAHDHPGPATDFYLGVYGICMPGNNKLSDIACHDMGLYEALWALGMFGVFTLLDRRPKVPGYYAFVLGLSYAPARFFLDSFRPIDRDPRYLGMTPAQICCVVAFIVCAIALRSRMNSGDKPVWAPPGSTPSVPAA